MYELHRPALRIGAAQEVTVHLGEGQSQSERRRRTRGLARGRGRRRAARRSSTCRAAFHVLQRDAAHQLCYVARGPPTGTINRPSLALFHGLTCVFQYVERHDLADVFQPNRQITVASPQTKRDGRHEQTSKKATETKASDTIMVIDSEEGSEPPKDQTPAAVASADHAVVAQSSEPATSTASSQEEEGQDARLSSQPVPRSVLDVLRSEDYLQLSAAERLEVLRFLIDEVLQTDSFWYNLLVPIIISYLLHMCSRRLSSRHRYLQALPGRPEREAAGSQDRAVEGETRQERGEANPSEQGPGR